MSNEITDNLQDSGSTSVEITSPSIIYAPLTTKTVTSQANAPIVTETAGLPLSNIELNTPVTNNIVNLSSTTSEVNTPAATEIAVETPGILAKYIIFSINFIILIHYLINLQKPIETSRRTRSSKKSKQLELYSVPVA
ncbi:3548_t:CDS:2 [Rhizophagus irregularis]|nr:3548_t:CDS:2 [Rhizophagus irregularis]